jgi:hypothetical protein
MEEVRHFCLRYPHPLTDVAVDLGKVLAGIQVPPSEYAGFDQFLEQLGYHYVEETNNEVYKRYLRT